MSDDTKSGDEATKPTDIREREDGELSDDDLEQVAGGISDITITKHVDKPSSGL